YIDSTNPENEILYFYSEGAEDSMTAAPVYNLTAGQGVAMQERDAEPTAPGVVIGTRTKRWEENLRFFPHATGDRWLGKQIFAPSSRMFELDDITPTEANGAQLTLELWSSSESEANPDHHIEVKFNEMRLTEKFWDGITDITSERQLNSGELHRSDNTLSIQAFGDEYGGGESIYVNAIQLVYESFLVLGNRQLAFKSDAPNLMVGSADEHALLFDVSDAQKPMRLVNTRVDDDGVSFAGAELGASFVMLKPRAAIQPELSQIPVWEQSLKEAGQGADYIVIIPPLPQFEETLSPLLAHRESEGLVVQAVALEQIYDEFSFGYPTPNAIRKFLTYATESWSPAPRFVLLVGDASYDLHNFTDGDNTNLIPTQLSIDSAESLSADDSWLTRNPDNSLNQTIAIGRFPVQNRMQLATLVGKTLAYENGTDETRNWQRRALLVADDQPQFADATLSLATAVRDAGFSPLQFDMTRSETLNDSIISAINQGVGIINYAGEGDLEVWGDERVLRAADSTNLINGTRLPVLTTFTTRNGYFNHPQTNTLVEQLLLADNGGIVAAIAPSGHAPNIDQLAFGSQFYETLLQAGEPLTLGEALQSTRILSQKNSVSQTINLLGDPALHIYQPNKQP
ncbi:MAG: C25 family cysteine peptidase, partial [Candidatus Promineifilaceae bacterium]